MKLKTILPLFLIGILSLTSCSRMGMTDKVGLILVTAGTAGTVMSYQSQAQAAGAVGGGAVAALIPASSALVIDRSPASSNQIARVEGRAEEILQQMPVKKREEMKKKEIKYIAVKTPQKATTRGQASVMVYDIESRRVASPTVFDVRIEPEIGGKIKFDTFVTEYVGAGAESDASFLDGAPQTAGD